MLSHANSQVIPGVWNNSTEKLFEDGVGRKDGFEVVIMESSGPFPTEYIDHSLEDTWKLITMTNNSLHNEILKYQNASFETAKNLAPYISKKGLLNYQRTGMIDFVLFSILNF